MNAIKINVAQQLKESVGSVRHIEMDETTEEDLSLRGEVQLLRTNRSILVTGKLRTTNRLTCSRCLEEFDHPLALDVEEEYSLPQNAASVSSAVPPNKAGAFAIDENNILDLSEAVRQYTLMSLPMKPICQPDCAGLCPSCGCNLNHGTCSCTPVRPDSHWSQLQSLLTRE
ncbi:MAG: DUF177 domain-containing protein [Dehalococcoidia bacterium]